MQPDRVQTLEIGYRVKGRSTDGPLAGGASWSSVHGKEGTQRLAEESVLITGDVKLVELQGALRYRIAQPRVWLFEVRDAPALLRSATESVLRETVAGHTFGDLLTGGRAAFQAEVLDRLRQRVKGYSSGGLGVELESLLLNDLHPPPEVVPAYHAVTQAMERRDQRIHRAQAAALSQKRIAEANKQQTILTAEAESHELLEKAQAHTEAFGARWQARSTLSWSVELALLAEAGRLLREGKPAQEAAQTWARQRQETLAVQAQLTDFRLYWEALAGALIGRDKVIVDSDKVPGRRHLLLLPPEMLRPPAILVPPRRDGEVSNP